MTTDLLNNPLRAYTQTGNNGSNGGPEYNINFSLNDELGLKRLADGGFFDSKKTKS